MEGNKTTFLTGPSGCGKSTLLRLFNKTASPGSGRVLFYGEDIASMNTLVLRRRVLLVGQSVFLFSTSIADNFNHFFAYRGQNPPEISEMKKYLAICRADFPLESRCDTLSGGERQRVFLAVCLAMQPEVLLLDEPSSALDRNHADAVIAGIKAWAHENSVTLVVVSHDPVLTARFADCTLSLAGGNTL
ncbi:MAG: ABC transporter ATP-binding protein [Pygmaiobacter sp.]|nr:ABC transporter ATP-binding protein [Pygmaiobacter sp.]